MAEPFGGGRAERCGPRQPDRSPVGFLGVGNMGLVYEPPAEGAPPDGAGAREGDLDGEHALLAAVYRQKAGVLRRMALGITRDPAAADDLVQDAFARTLRARRAPDQSDQLFYYLVRVVVNLTRSRAARDARRTRRDAASCPDDGVQAEHGLADDALAHAVGRLPRRQREVVFLRFWLDLSVEQTASALGISPGAVKTHSARALAYLRGAVTNAPPTVPPTGAPDHPDEGRGAAFP